MKTVYLRNEEEFKYAFDDQNRERVEDGDVVVIINEISLQCDIMIDRNVSIKLQQGTILTNGHLLLKKDIKFYYKN